MRLRRRKKPGKVIIYPHIHAHRLFPEKRIREELKKADIINLERSSKEGRLRETIKWNLLSKVGIDLINPKEYSKIHQEYITSLKKIIRRSGKRIELERGSPTYQRILLFFKFPILRRESEFKILMKRTKKDIEQIKKHVEKGRVVGILRGAAHEQFLLKMLREKGIEYESVPLGGYAVNPKGTPLLFSQEKENLVRQLYNRKAIENKATPLFEVCNTILAEYPGLEKYPTALYHIANALIRTRKTITKQDLKTLQDFVVTEPLSGKKVTLKSLAKH